ncbi:uncharacterized protein LOC126839691 isoform X2 [Adelges cooleyi]|uniref:uncharacterized protein LOC126839691 isoform X2 n=1 Tax=Adelges cooleyi TaxID=133065 RepID=UPI00218061D4|nr:uncharacterized protein LOC126839691 isoform X2 [Adelges cooleyi]
MKLFSLLISFLFLAGVLADDESDYMDNVLSSTEFFRIAYFDNGLVDLDGGYRINGLEVVIEEMVDDINNQYTYENFCKINFLIAVPEARDILSHVADPQPSQSQTDLHLNQTQKANLFLDHMIRIIGVPLIGYRVKYTYTTSFGTLKEVANETRKFVVPALRNLMIRRLLGESVQRVNDQASLLPNCRLLGLYLSTQSPELYIKEVRIESTSRTCIFKDKNDTQIRYRKFGATWSKINADDQPGESLEELLQRGHPQNLPTPPEISILVP